MISLVRLVVSAIVVALLAYLVCVLLDALPHVPGWSCTVVWIVALLLWVLVVFGDDLRTRL